MARLRRRATKSLGDNEAIRRAIRTRVHLLPTKEEQLYATRFLTETQRALLGHLCPTYQSVCKFLDHCRPGPELLKVARRELKADIQRAQGQNHGETSHLPKTRN